MSIVVMKRWLLLTWTVSLCLLAFGGWQLFDWFRVLPMQANAEEPQFAAAPIVFAPPQALPSELRSASPADVVVEAQEATLFSLAGIVQTYVFGADETDPGSRIALIDIMDGGKVREQVMVSEGDTIEGYRLSTVGENSAVLVKNRDSITLVLEGELAAASQGSAKAADEETASKRIRLEDLPALEQTPYGKRIADNQWVVSYKTMVEFGQDMMDNPVRAARLLSSFEEVEDTKVNGGFKVDIKGDSEFFGHMGLKNGDVVRKVNSMKMKNAGRAQYLVTEFMKERMSAVVLDIERDGKMEKLIYIVR